MALVRAAERSMLGLLVGLTLAAPLALSPQTATAREEQPLKCDIGPLTKTFGRTPWLVYGCADHKSVVIVSDQGNPAMPFVFIFAVVEGGYKLHGEGTGDKSATAAAFEELKALSSADIEKLLAAAKASAVNPPTDQQRPPAPG